MIHNHVKQEQHSAIGAVCVENPTEDGIYLAKRAIKAPAPKKGPVVPKVQVGDESTNNPTVVEEYDFFKSSSTKVLNRRHLFIAPALFEKKKGNEQIADEVYDRLLDLNHYFEGKNVLLRIHISRKDVKVDRRMRVIQAAIGEVDRLMCRHHLEHVFIFDPLCMSMERISWSKPA